MFHWRDSPRPFCVVRVRLTKQRKELEGSRAAAIVCEQASAGQDEASPTRVILWTRYVADGSSGAGQPYASACKCGRQLCGRVRGLGGELSSWGPNIA